MTDLKTATDRRPHSQSEGGDRLFGRAALAASVALVFLLGGTFAVIAWPRVTHAVGVKPKPPEPAYRIGQTTDTPAAWHGTSAHTLILIARSECGACQQARPFLASLVSDVKARGAVVLASPGADPAAERRFGHEIGLDNASVMSLPSRIRATQVPTLLLVDRTGRILGAWEGVPPAQQDKIRAALTAVLGR